MSTPDPLTVEVMFPNGERRQLPAERVDGEGHVVQHHSPPPPGVRYTLRPLPVEGTGFLRTITGMWLAYEKGDTK
jgi:hypothetical protein